MAHATGNVMAGEGRSAAGPAAGPATGSRLAVHGSAGSRAGGLAWMMDRIRLLRACDSSLVRAKAAGELEAAGIGYVEKAAMNEQSGTLGGYLAPPAVSTRLLKTAAEKSFIWQRATVVPMESLTVDCPAVDNSTNQTGASPMFGGMIFKWGSGAFPVETEPKFRMVRLTAWDLLGWLQMSNQFLSDAGPAADDALIELIARAASWQAEWAFLQGLGTDGQMPVGLINSPARALISRAVANQISAADIAKMVTALIPGSRDTAIWAASPTTESQILQLSNFFLSGGEPGGAKTGAVLANRPFFATEKLPALGTLGDLVLFDPQLYAIGQRQEVVIDVSPHAAFPTGQTVFRVWLRVDGKPVMNKPVVLADGVTTASCVVVLN